MQIRFTKMQGAGNDFVVLDETRGPLGLTPAQYRFLADRHFGVGADQILGVRPSLAPGIDFEYVIHNADGSEVEQCGNGSRCFVRFVVDQGLTSKRTIRVQTKAGVIAPELMPSGEVRVDMGPPAFAPARIPFLDQGLSVTTEGQGQRWTLNLPAQGSVPAVPVPVSVASMGNPHALVRVEDVATAPVGDWGPRIQTSGAFPQGVNVGFVQVLSPTEVKLRVYERGAGETLACGSGACAAVALGVRLGWLQAGAPVRVHTRGGVLTIEWSGDEAQSVWMTGPAVSVFEGQITLPDLI